MRRWKKITLAILLLLLLSQSPFIYRRYRLGQLSKLIDEINASRAATPDHSFRDYKGVLHVHSFLGGHSEGKLDEIVRAARVNELDFVVMTEHPSSGIDTSEATLKGVHEGVLFINGSELVTASGDRLLILPGVIANTAQSGTSDVIRNVHGSGKLAFVAYPQQIEDWSRVNGHDGIEVYNLYTNTDQISYPVLFFDCLWSCGSYPELLFSTFFEKSAAGLKSWDSITERGNRSVAVAGNDAHSNVRIALGESGEGRLIDIRLDPYERTFKLVRNHVLLASDKTLDATQLLDALKSGHSYIAFDVFADGSGFRFFAENSSEVRIMGDEITRSEAGEVKLSVDVPVNARIAILENGKTIHQMPNTRKAEVVVKKAGVYRVEVYLDRLKSFLGERPWIISNPIYVR